MFSAQERVFNTPELLVHILRRVHGGHMGSKSYRKSDLLRLWQARSVSKLFYDCVLETFAQKHVKWTTVILELGQFETEIDSNDEADPRSVPDTSAEACWEIDESHSESEEEYIFGDRVTGRLTLEYEFHGWVEEGLYPTGFSPDRKTHAIFRPKDGVLPYDAELCRERIWKLAENKSVYPHTGVIMWNIAHDLRLPELYLWSEDGKIMFDWRKFLRGFFALEREVCRVRTIKFHRWQPFGSIAFRPIYRIQQLSETDLDFSGQSETDNERRTYHRRLHLIRSKKISRKRSGHKYVKQMLTGQRRGTPVERPEQEEPGYGAFKLDEKATRRSLRHLHRAQDPDLYHFRPDEDMPSDGECDQVLCTRHWDAHLKDPFERKRKEPEIRVKGWPDERNSFGLCRYRTLDINENGDEADDELSQDEGDSHGPHQMQPSYYKASPFLKHWRWSERHLRDENLRLCFGNGYLPGDDGWYTSLGYAGYLVKHKPGAVKAA